MVGDKQPEAAHLGQASCPKEQAAVESAPMHEIVQGIFLGGERAALDWELLRRHGICTVVNCAAEIVWLTCGLTWTTTRRCTWGMSSQRSAPSLLVLVRGARQCWCIASRAGQGARPSWWPTLC
mmetsp:Transcript_116053/g.323263  ORF Transcript_116053/g.323263 Transcript_116053/m.323263 type:complete len:124 (-) Transcript_116053:257-628(-)